MLEKTSQIAHAHNNLWCIWFWVPRKMPRLSRLVISRVAKHIRFESYFIWVWSMIIWSGVNLLDYRPINNLLMPEEFNWSSWIEIVLSFSFLNLKLILKFSRNWDSSMYNHFLMAKIFDHHPWNAPLIEQDDQDHLYIYMALYKLLVCKTQYLTLPR